MKLLHKLYEAYFRARVNKRNTVNQLEFELNLEANLYRLAEDIAARRYQISPSIAFVVTEPTKREIFAATFRDRVVHHLVFDYINPYWERKFIYDAYSCRVGKGTSFGVKRMARFMRSVSDNYTREAWILKLDILGYFMHIDRELVWQTCLQQFEDERRWQGQAAAPGQERQTREERAADDELIKYLLQEIIFNDPTIDVKLQGNLDNWQGLPRDKSLFYAAEGQGFPIGNVTSQLFSNIYLHNFDCFVKYQLGCKYYGRYVDDFVIMDREVKRLLAVKRKIKRFLGEKLGLTLHPRKMYLQPVQRGLTFLGAEIKPYVILPGKRILKNYRLGVRGHYEENRRAVWLSYLGHLKQLRHYRLLEVLGEGG